MAGTFVHPLRVRYAECDPQGIVFNAHYLAYFDLAMTELWRARCGGYAAMVASGVDMVVAEVTARFLVPAAFDDELGLAVSVEKIGRTSLVTSHAVRRAGEVCVEGDMRHVFVDLATRRATPVPQKVRDALEGLSG